MKLRSTGSIGWPSLCGMDHVGSAGESHWYRFEELNGDLFAAHCSHSAPPTVWLPHSHRRCKQRFSTGGETTVAFASCALACSAISSSYSFFAGLLATG